MTRVGPGLKRGRLGRTPVQVTELGFGGAPIGNLYAPVSDEQSRAAVDAAWDAGVRYFDTAPHYGLGLSERRLGAALRDRPRGEYAISTKVGRLLVRNPAPLGSDVAVGGFAVPDTLTRVFDFSRDGVRRSLESSLDRLGLDRIDIVLIHDPDDPHHLDTALAHAVPALIELREQGVIGAVGAGMNTVDPLLRFVAESDVDVVMVAGRWTLLDRSAAPLLDACAARGVAVLAAAPFNSGLLADPRPAEGTPFNYAPAPPELLASARRYAELARAHGVALPQLALQFPLRHPAVASVVAGMATPEQSAADAAWLAAPVPETLWDVLVP